MYNICHLSFFTVQDTAKILKVSIRKVQDLIDNKELRSVKYHKEFVLLPDSVIQYKEHGDRRFLL